MQFVLSSSVLWRHDNNSFAFQNGARGIHTAAMKGHVSVINTLLAKGENVDAATNVMIKMLFRILYHTSVDFLRIENSRTTIQLFT